MSIEPKALTLAYNCVICLGWNHLRLSREYSLTSPTLRRIRNGRKGSNSTNEIYMKVFLTIIEQEFHNDLKDHGGRKSGFFHKSFREILLALFQVGEVKKLGTILSTVL